MDRMNTIATSLCAPLYFEGLDKPQFSIRERMEKYKVPGVSMALIDQSEVAWVKTWGLSDIDSAEGLNPKTLFQAASM